MSSNEIVLDFKSDVEGGVVGIDALATPLSLLENATNLALQTVQSLGRAVDDALSAGNVSTWLSNADKIYLSMVDTFTSIPETIAATASSISKLAPIWDNFITYYRVLKLEKVGTLAALKGALQAMSTTVKIGVGMTVGYLIGKGLAYIFDEISAYHDRGMRYIMETADIEKAAYDDFKFLHQQAMKRDDDELKACLDHAKKMMRAQQQKGEQFGQIAVQWQKILSGTIQKYRNLEAQDALLLAKEKEKNELVEKLLSQYKINIEAAETLEIRERAMVQLWKENKTAILSNSNSSRAYLKDLQELERQLGPDGLDPALKKILNYLLRVNNSTADKKTVDAFSQTLGLLPEMKTSEKVTLLEKAIDDYGNQCLNNTALLAPLYDLIQQLRKEVPETSKALVAVLDRLEAKILSMAKETNTLVGEELLLKQKSDEYRKGWQLFTDDCVKTLDKENKILIDTGQEVMKTFGSHEDIMKNVRTSVLDRVNAYVKALQPIPKDLQDFARSLQLVPGLYGEWVTQLEALNQTLMLLDKMFPMLNLGTLVVEEATETSGKDLDTGKDKMKETEKDIKDAQKALAAFKKGMTLNGEELDEKTAALLDFVDGVADIALGIVTKNPVQIITGVFKVVTAIFKFFGAKDWGKEARKALSGLPNVTKEMQQKLKDLAEELEDTDEAFRELLDEFIQNVYMRNYAHFSSWSQKLQAEKDRLDHLADSLAKCLEAGVTRIGVLITVEDLEQEVIETTRQVDEAFAALAARAEQLGVEGSEDMLYMIRGANELRDKGWKIPEVFKYVEKKLTAGMEAFKGYVSSAADIASEIESSQSRLADLDLGTSEYKSTQSELTQLETKFSQLSGQESFDRAQTYAVGFMNAMMAEGKSMMEVLESMGTQLDDMLKIQETGNYEAGVLTELLDLRSLVNNNKEIATQISSSRQMLESFGNSGYLNAQLLKSSEKDAQDAFAALRANGESAKSAIQVLAPLLAKQLWYSTQYNMELDDSTKDMIATGEEMGINFLSMVPPFEYMAKLLEDIVTNFGLEIPYAAGQSSQAAQQGCGQTSDGALAVSAGAEAVARQVDSDLPQGFNQLNLSALDSLGSINAAAGQWTAGLAGVGTHLNQTLPTGFAQIQSANQENTAATATQTADWQSNLTNIGDQALTQLPTALQSMQTATGESTRRVNDDANTITAAFDRFNQAANTGIPEAVNLMHQASTENVDQITQSTGQLTAQMDAINSQARDEIAAAWQDSTQGGIAGIDQLVQQGGQLNLSLDTLKLKAQEELPAAWAQTGQSGAHNFAALSEKTLQLQTALDHIKTEAEVEVPAALAHAKDSGTVNLDIVKEKSRQMESNLDQLKTTAGQQVPAAWEQMKHSGQAHLEALQTEGGRLQGQWDQLAGKASTQITAAMGQLKDKGVARIDRVHQDAQSWGRHIDDLQEQTAVKMVQGFDTLQKDGTGALTDAGNNADRFSRDVDDAKNHLETQTLNALKQIPEKAGDAFTRAGDNAGQWVDSLSQTHHRMQQDIYGGFQEMNRGAQTGFGSIQTETRDLSGSLSSVEKQIRENLSAKLKEFDDDYTDAMSGHSIVTDTHRLNNALSLQEVFLIDILPDLTGKLESQYSQSVARTHSRVAGASGHWQLHFSVLERIDHYQQMYDQVNRNLEAQGQRIRDNNKRLDDENLTQEQKNELEKITQLLEQELQDLLEQRSAILIRSESFIQISDDMQDRIEELAGENGDLHAATSTLMAEIIREADLNQQNFDSYAQRTHEILADLIRGTLTIQETEEAMGSAFSELLSAAQQLGTEGSAAMVALLKDSRNAGLEIGEMQDYVNAKLDKGVQALADYVGTFTQTSPIQEELDKINESLLTNQTSLDAVNQELMSRGLSQERIIQLEEQARTLQEERLTLLDDLILKEEEFRDAQDAIGENWDFMQAMTMSTFSALQSQGYSFIESVNMMGDELTALATMAADNGLDMLDGLKTMTDTAAFIENNEGLATRIESTRTLLQALGDSAYLTAGDFSLFGEQTTTQYQDIFNQTQDSEMALRLIAPSLKELVKYSKTYGFTIDGNTQKLIDQATAEGLLSEDEKSAAQVMNGLLLTIAQAMHADIPADIAALAGGVQTGIDSATGQTVDWDDSLGTVHKEMTTTLPTAIDGLDQQYKDKMTGHSIVTKTRLWKSSLDSVKKMMVKELPDSVTKLDDVYTDKMTGHSIVTNTTKWKHTADDVNAVLGRDLLETADSLDSKYSHVMDNVYLYLQRTSKDGFIARMNIDEMVDELDTLQDAYDQLARKKVRTDQENNIMADYKRQIKELSDAVEETAPTLENLQKHFKTYREKLSGNIGVNKGMITIARDVRHQGQTFSEIDSIIDKSLSSGAKGLSAWVEALGARKSQLDDILKLQAQHAELAAKETLTAEESLQISQLQLEIQQNTQQVQTSMEMDAGAITNAQQIMTVYFHSLQAEGKNIYQISTIMKDSFDALAQKDLTALFNQPGFQLSQPFDRMYRMQQKMADNQSLIDGVSGLSQALHGLGDSMLYLSADHFGTFQTAAQKAHQKIIAAGFDQEQALQLMAPILQDLQDYAREYGYSLDQQNAQLLADAREHNLIKEEQKSDTQVLVEVSQQMEAVLMELQSAFSGLDDLGSLTTDSEETLLLKKKINRLQSEIEYLRQDQQAVQDTGDQRIAQIDQKVTQQQTRIAQQEETLALQRQKSQTVQQEITAAIDDQTAFIQELEKETGAETVAAAGDLRYLERQLELKGNQKTQVQKELDRVAGKSPLMEERARVKLAGIEAQIQKLEKQYRDAKEISALTTEKAERRLQAAVQKLDQLEYTRSKQQEKALIEETRIQKEIEFIRHEIDISNKERQLVQQRTETQILMLQSQMGAMQEQLGFLIDQLRFGPINPAIQNRQQDTRPIGTIDGDPIAAWSMAQTLQIMNSPIRSTDVSDQEEDTVIRDIVIRGENGDEALKDFIKTLQERTYGGQPMAREVY